MVLLAIAGAAVAADIFIDIPFEEPANVPLFLKAEVLTIKGTLKEDDCPGAAQAAVDEAAAKGTIVRVIVSPTNMAGAAQAICKQRKAGDTISASVVELNFVVVQPGAPATVYASIGAERTAQIAALLAALAGGDLSSALIDDIGGKAWVRLGQEVWPDEMNSKQLDDNARAVKAYEEFVPSWVSRWANVVATIPEVQGAVMEVEVVSEDPDRGRKSRVTEMFRFAVPTEAAQAFLKGQMADDQFLAHCRVERALDLKTRDFQPIGLDVLEGGMAKQGEHGTVKREGLDVSDEDLEGVEDLDLPEE